MDTNIYVYYCTTAVPTSLNWNGPKWKSKLYGNILQRI